MIISQNDPICPRCKALMIHRHLGKVYYICVDCKAIYRVVCGGKAENELVVTDRKENNETGSSCLD